MIKVVKARIGCPEPPLVVAIGDPVDGLLKSEG
jgi:hypothetical protein